MTSAEALRPEHFFLRRQPQIFFFGSQDSYRQTESEHAGQILQNSRTKLHTRRKGFSHELQTLQRRQPKLQSVLFSRSTAYEQFVVVLIASHAS